MGHDTEKCRQLKDEIEWLVQRESLNKFIHPKTTDNRRLILNEAINKGAHRGAKAELVRVINIIVGGSSLKVVATKRK